MGWNTAGFEIGNVLDRRAYPAARTRRAGPPPSGLPSDFDPNAARGVPIRSRPVAFIAGETLGRCVLALGSFVGPALVKGIDIAHSNLPDNPSMPHWNLFYNTTPYTTANDIPQDTQPAGTPLLAAIAARDSGQVKAQEGGIWQVGQTVNGNRWLLNYYIPDATWYLALVIRNVVNTPATVSGVCLVYEGILPSDFPAILG